jgi:hypothetical protein
LIDELMSYGMHTIDGFWHVFVNAGHPSGVGSVLEHVTLKSIDEALHVPVRYCAPLNLPIGGDESPSVPNDASVCPQSALLAISSKSSPITHPFGRFPVDWL